MCRMTPACQGTNAGMMADLWLYIRHKTPITGIITV
jgi:hypothetical protein